MRNLSGTAWIRRIYDGKPTSDATTSDGAFGTAIDIDQSCPRVLFLIHGIKEADTSDSTMHWYIMKQTTFAYASDADFSDYSNITGATHGVVTVVDSAAATYAGDYMLDVNAQLHVGAKGSLLFHAYSSDATTMELHVSAIGYGGNPLKSQAASDLVCV
jgi:hypothetical protein